MTLFKSETVDDAIEEALQQLQLDRSQVEVSVVAKPRRGFLGFGARKAQVDVKPLVQPAEKPVAKAAPSAPADSAVISKSAAPSQKAGDEAPEKPAPQTQEPASRQAEYQRVADELNTYLLEIVNQLGIDATSSVEVVHRRLTINFETEQEGLLIGKHGRTINALQSLAQVFLNHKRFSKLEVTLDVANYRERRVETLTRLAENMAREVVATGKPVYLDPMPSFERKQIHSVLADNEHVMTYSAGTEPKRAVVITLR
ncbi:RNA-binding cell elongation regulator Jag/EloR [Secundilactobacillus folii]|uniref:RNA-binding protein KhpB n=1 Tax=Secundilactobacillus folii TaxID=2678357 RepID=A0A7X2XTQ8_9LACO|nr:RNA-binding cell elongation regulator Jag/EloR [Secundilactobacillus folii]MTV81431.1 KH domain-containing protein [Secundilactobacillus folii]